MPSRVANPKVVDRVVGPSADVYNGVPVEEMSESDIDRFVQHYANAAKNSLDAGFSGVELHGANGYVSRDCAACRASATAADGSLSTSSCNQFQTSVQTSTVAALRTGCASLFAC